ncbi:MAG TPA: hypothetical protein VGS04_07660 [Nitrososphaerales archaeon]|nr:hypothetical protein [Nitrososphaerales archaeon]
MRPSKVAAIGLLLLLLIPFSAAAASLPSPPDRSAPANNQSGQLPNAQSFTGGVSLVRDGSTSQNVSANEFVVEFYCINHGPYVSKQFETSIGESISGPLSAAQASGVIDAANSVRPSRLVNLTVTVGGLDTGGNITYVMTGMTYNVTTYSVWVTSQQSPAAETRVGYIVVSVPARPQVTEYSQDLAGSSCSDTALSKAGPGWTNPAVTLGNPLAPFSTPPEGGFAPIFNYGTVRVLSGSGVAGAASIRPRENATFLLPPGTYSAVADVTLFGIPFGVGIGTYSSPRGAATAQFTVSLNSVYGIWYGLEILALAILVAVILLLDRRFHLWRALAHASRYFYGALRSGWRKVWESDK